MPDHHPTRSDAQALALDCMPPARGVVVLTLGRDGELHAASYGLHPGDDRDLRRLAEQIGEMVNVGDIELHPEPIRELGGEAGGA